MRRFLLALLFAAFAQGASAQTTVKPCTTVITAGVVTCPVVSSTNPMPVLLTGSGSTDNVNLIQVGGATIALGQALMAASIPVAIASNQGTLTVTGAGGTFPVTAASSALASGSMVDLVALSTPVAPATATATKSILLGAQATTAAVNPTTGQQGALSSDTNNNLLVSSGGAPNLAISQVSVATSDTAVVSARALRRAVTIQQITGTQNVFCNQTTATAGNGVVLPAVVGASFTFNTTSAIRCIAITGAQTVAVAETY